MILDEIAKHKAQEVARAKELVPLDELKDRALQRPDRRYFGEALLAQDGISLIAEVKKASPSAGVIREDFDAIEIARLYEDNGASAVSVLTDERFFDGSLEYLRAIRGAVHLPLLRKDFIIDPYQIYEARAAGADAVLLIVALLSDNELSSLLELAHELGMDCLVEVHTEDELRSALRSTARIIGINNRDLYSFRTDLETTFRLRELIPEERIVVSESGIKTPRDVERLRDHGVDAVLGGETLMRADDIGAAVRGLLGRDRRTIPRN